MLRCRRRPLFWTPLVAAVPGALVFAVRPQPLLVEGATVERGPLVAAVEAEGVTRSREVYAVSAPLAGRLSRLDLEVGDAVTAGTTVVARLLPTAPALLDARTRRRLEAELRAEESALAPAEARRARAEAEVRFARKELARAEAEQEVRRLEAKRAVARLLEPDAVNAVGPSGCCVEVRAPVDGVVLRLLQESEAAIEAGAPLVEIGDPHDLEVVVDVLSRDAVRLEPGAPARITGWRGEGELAGRIRRIEPFAFTEISALGIEEQRVNVIVDLTGPPERWARLGHGFRLDASLVVWAVEEVARLPVPALFRGDDGGWRVFRVAAGRVRILAFEVARRNAPWAQVVNVVAPGDRIVAFRSARLIDGARGTFRPS